MNSLNFLWIFLLPALGMADLSSDPLDITLDDYRWENRVLLIFSDQLSDDRFQQQISELSRNPAGMKERHLITVSLFKKSGSNLDGKLISQSSAENLKRTYRDQNRRFTFILIGKDGGVKLKSNDVVSADSLFGIIDQMPMRRQEMRDS